MDDNNKTPEKNENPNTNQTENANETSRTNVTSNDLFENLQDLHNTIADIVEPLQVAQDQLSSDNPENIKQTRKNIDTSLDFAQDLVAKIQQSTFERIERDHGTEALKEMHCNSNQTLIEEKLQCGSTENFHKILVLNHGSSKHHNIMLLDSTKAFEVLDSNQCRPHFEESDSSNDSYTSAHLSDDSNDCSESVKSNSSRLKNEMSELQENYKIIIAENQELQFALNNAVEENNSMEISLRSAAPYKLSLDGTIRFPGKQEMENKLLCMKKEILKLHANIREMKSIERKLKSVQIYIDQYGATNCPCKGSSFTNDTCDSNVKVRQEQIQQIRSQIKQKQEELNITKSNCELSEKLNQRINDKSTKLAKTLKDSKKELQELLLRSENGLVGKLNKTKEDIETLELVINERKEILRHYEQKLETENHDNSIIIKKTDDLEAALKNLLIHFKDAYYELQSAYQEQTEEIMMLPTVLKVTHIKLQEEIDMRVLAEETKKTLERSITNAEESRKSVPDKDEQTNKEVTQSIAELETQTKKLQSVLESLHKNIKLASTNLNKETENQEALQREIDNVIVESTRHANAFDNFSTIHMDGIIKEVGEIQTLLVKLQSKECAKEIIKRKVIGHIREKIVSMCQNVNECKSQIAKFKTNTMLSN